VTIPEADWVVLARIARPQGRRGEVIAEILTDFPESFRDRKRLFLQAEAGGQPAREAILEAWRPHQGRAALKFAGIDSIEDAERLRGLLVTVPRAERIPAGENAFYVSDLIGSRVTDLHGGDLRDAGEIIDVLPEGPGPAMLVVRTGTAEPLLIPFAKAYLKRVDLNAKCVEMDLPEGLLAMQAPLTAEEWRKLREEEQPESQEKPRGQRPDQP
jgi:16S rRNA processing protein RimM